MAIKNFHVYRLNLGGRITVYGKNDIEIRLDDKVLKKFEKNKNKLISINKNGYYYIKKKDKVVYRKFSKEKDELEPRPSINITFDDNGLPIFNTGNSYDIVEGEINVDDFTLFKFLNKKEFLFEKSRINWVLKYKDKIKILEEDKGFPLISEDYIILNNYIIDMNNKKVIETKKVVKCLDKGWTISPFLEPKLEVVSLFNAFSIISIEKCINKKLKKSSIDLEDFFKEGILYSCLDGSLSLTTLRFQG
jgi:hypothetical protein